MSYFNRLFSEECDNSVVLFLLSFFILIITSVIYYELEEANVVENVDLRYDL